MSNIDFASFDLDELEVLDVADGVALPEMGASVVIIALDTPDGEEILGEADLNSSGSVSTSCCC